jgi:hypothetical protein
MWVREMEQSFVIQDNYNPNIMHFPYLGTCYNKDAGSDLKTFLTRYPSLQVKDVALFGIIV